MTKIDRENKTFIFDNGEVLPIPKEAQKKVLRTESGKQSKKEAAERWKKQQRMSTFGETAHALSTSIDENFLGNLGDTLANYGISGIKAFKTGKGQQGLGYVDRVLDHFYAMQEARKEHLSELGKKHPIASGIGKGVGIAGELAALSPLRGALALPLMAAGHSETSFLEPEEKGKEIVKEGLTGLILDKFFGGLSKIAGHRESQRKIKDLISRTEESNLAEIQRAAGATEAEKLRFTNEAAAREVELKRLSQVQEGENLAFKQANESSVDRISQTMGKQSISNEALGVEDFISQAIDTSAHAATREGNYTSKFLRSIFKGDKNGKITGESLKRGSRALDEAILKNEGEIKQLLIEYKDFLNKSLPERLGASYVYEKWIPKILKGTEPLEKSLGDLFKADKRINDSLIQRLGGEYINTFNEGINTAIIDTVSGFKNSFHGLDPVLLRQELSNAIRTSPEYEKMINRVNSMFPDVKNVEFLKKSLPEYAALLTSLEKYPEILSERISKSYQRYFPDIASDFATKSGVTESALQKSPVSPTVVPQPPPVSPAQTIQPNLQAVPTMPQPQGIYGKLAQGLENFRDTGLKPTVNAIKQNLPSIGLAKLAGIPLGKAAVGAATIAGGARALTSPSAAGKALRTGLDQGARGIISQIEQMASKYPSYHDGVVEDPQEKRSLTKEIENLRDVSLEEKAVFQSKVNRGKPLQDRL